MTNEDVMKILAGNVELVLALYRISLVLCETASFSYIITVELISPGLHDESNELTFYLPFNQQKFLKLSLGRHNPNQ